MGKEDIKIKVCLSHAIGEVSQQSPEDGLHSTKEEHSVVSI